MKSTNRNVTLKQIAQQAGVSITTVHRVLNGKEGCSDALKEKILKLAHSQGYTHNYLASSLSKKTIHVILLFPAKTPLSKLFLQQVFDGYLEFREEISQFNIVFQECYYSIETNGKNSLQSWLEKIYCEQPVKFDGVILYGITLSLQISTLINKIIARKIPVVLLEQVPPNVDEACCVAPDATLAGKMSGELISKFTLNSGSVVIFEQTRYPHDVNGASCAAEIKTRRRDLQVIRHPLSFVQGQTSNIQSILLQTEQPIAVYCTCARHTSSYLSTIDALPRTIKTAIGSEVFDESLLALTQGSLDAIIDKRPHRIGHRALEVLFAHIVKGMPLPTHEIITPHIVLQSNSITEYQNKENFYDNRTK